MKVASLFSGLGALDLGLQQVAVSYPAPLQAFAIDSLLEHLLH